MALWRKSGDFIGKIPSLMTKVVLFCCFSSTESWNKDTA